MPFLLLMPSLVYIWLLKNLHKWLLYHPNKLLIAKIFKEDAEEEVPCTLSYMLWLSDLYLMKLILILNLKNLANWILMILFIKLKISTKLNLVLQRLWNMSLNSSLLFLNFILVNKVSNSTEEEINHILHTVIPQKIPIFMF